MSSQPPVSPLDATGQEAAPAPRRWARTINLLIGLVGVVVLAAGLFWVGQGSVRCRGVEMYPGDVCTKSTFSELNSDTTQTYEQRRASARASRPTVIGLGVALIGFSALMVVMDRRRAAAQEPQAT